MSNSTLDGRKVVVVGASAGIGRAFAIGAVKAGATVVMAARRKDRLDEVIAEAGGGIPVVVDLRDPDSCLNLGSAAAGALGKIDLVFFSAGASPLRQVEQTTAQDWAMTMATNVIGINLGIAALLPSLAPRAVVAACSSESVGHPHWGLVAYGSSKAALEESLRGWRLEHPEVRFTCIGVGATTPTEFGDGFDHTLLFEALEIWARHGLARQELMRTDELADVLVESLAVALAHPGVGFEHLTLRSPAGVTDRKEAFEESAAENIRRKTEELSG